MKYFLPILALFLWSCSKVEITPEQNINSKAPKSLMAARSPAFPTTIYLGEDSVCNRITSIRLWDYYCYLSTCGVNPEYEAPNMGQEVYQIAGPTQTIIGWANWTATSIPTIQGLEPGIYKFVGHAWVTGYRACDSSFQNQHAYDTLTLTILKRRAKVKP
jgi:hypothetical protein